MNLEQARANMVEQQIRPWEVLDQDVLDLMSSMARDEFVPAPYRNLAYADISIPLDDGQVMMPPRVEARLLQALQLEAEDRVLEIGTGSGFVTAALARLAGHVISVEISPGLHARAARTLKLHQVDNVQLIQGDAVHGWAPEAPYDAIAVTGSVPELEPELPEQLSPGGRLFVVVGEAPVMEARLVTRTGARQWSTESLFETVIPALIGVRDPERFAF